MSHKKQDTDHLTHNSFQLKVNKTQFLMPNLSEASTIIVNDGTYSEQNDLSLLD